MKGTTTRRANGMGSITAGPDKSLLVRVTDPATGRRVKRVVRRLPDETTVPHRRRAEAVLANLHNEITRPGESGDGWTVARWAESRYLVAVEAAEVSPTTLQNYRDLLRLYVVPHVGGIALHDLRPDHIDAMETALRTNGHSPRTRRAARATLRRVLEHARRKGVIDVNPTDRADRLTVDRPDVTRDVLQPDEVRALLAAAKGTRWELPVALMATLGWRRGEVLGLGWDAVDLDAGLIRVARNLVNLRSNLLLKSPKTRTSRRTMELSPQLVALLRHHRARQHEDRLRAGEAWQPDHVDVDGTAVALVHTDEVGRPIAPHRLATALEALARKAGLGHVHPHALRHGYVSLLLAEGHDLAAVAAAAGHSSAAVTANVYAHALDRTRVAATAAMADAVGAW